MEEKHSERGDYSTIAERYDGIVETTEYSAHTFRAVATLSFEAVK